MTIPKCKSKCKTNGIPLSQSHQLKQKTQSLWVQAGKQNQRTWYCPSIPLSRRLF